MDMPPKPPYIYINDNPTIKGIKWTTHKKKLVMTWIWNDLVEKITIKEVISLKNIEFKLIMT
jgi:hypothetical protein